MLILKEERAENTQVLVEIFQKVPKNAFFVFFQKFACRQFGQIRVFVVVWESSEN